MRTLCRLFGVSPSGFYASRTRPESKRVQEDRRLKVLVHASFTGGRGYYGSPRIHDDFIEWGEHVSRKRIIRLKQEEGLHARVRKRYKVTTDSDHDQPVAPNLLLDRPAPSKVDEVWVADITYVPTAEGWLFVAAVMDLYSRQILGWSVWESLAARGALQALARARVKRGYPRGVIHHSDRGIQYACAEYRRELQRHGLVASMSRRGNCYDNAAMEAFWSTLKREALEESDNWSSDRVRRELFEFIESDYNRSRLHSSLDYRSPVEFEQQKH